MRPFIRIGIVLTAAFVLAGAASLERSDRRPTRTPADPNGVVVHEWGTFTSVAGPDGSPVEWIPQQGPSDLPCFVDRARHEAKGWLRARVRMETPVLYFYAPEDTTLDVRVRFRQGVMTEWYPRASVTPSEIKQEMLTKPDFAGEISWKQVKVLSQKTADFPTDSSSNHYYAARATDAAPIQVGAQREKFLFYRGVANFDPPLRARALADGRVLVKAPADRTIGDVMLFENRGGLTAHYGFRSNERQTEISARGPGGSSRSAARDLEDLLVGHGLYRREAQAMIDTWRDSWFEEGTRLFYLVAPQTIDEVLPLDIAPKPAAVARVFVGRIELLTAATIEEVKTALEQRDRVAILKHRRFLGPIMERIHPASADRLRADWQFVYDAVRPTTRGCS